MKGDRFRRSLVVSASVHAVVILLVVIVPALISLFHRPKPKDILMVDLLNALPPLPTPPEPRPVEAKETPEPVKKEIEEPKEKQKIKVNTNRVKRAVVQQEQPKSKPPLTPEEIRKLLSAGMPQGGSASAGEASEMAWYYALVRAAMYEAWEPPASIANAGLTADVQIRVQRDGSITQRRLTRGSGNAVMDASVLKAAESVSRLKPLPASFSGSFHDITISFQPTSSSIL